MSIFKTDTDSIPRSIAQALRVVDGTRMDPGPPPAIDENTLDASEFSERWKSISPLTGLGFLYQAI